MFGPLKTVKTDWCTLINDDCLNAVRQMPENTFDSFCSDPPYHLTSIVRRFSATSEHDDNGTGKRARDGADALARLSRGFMGKTWDGGEIAQQPATWAEFYRVLKPGAHIAVFGGTRTFHRMAVAIEDAGFEIRDTLMWLYSTGFPKSHDVSKGIDAHLGAEREKVRPKSVIGHQRNIGNRRPYMDNPDHMTVSDEPATSDAERWQGWGTALKPAFEPIILARKPLIGSVAQNVLRYGTGALNIDACRIGTDVVGWGGKAAGGNTWNHSNMGLGKDDVARPVEGRWPANVLHDGSGEVVAMFPDTGTGKQRIGRRSGKEIGTFGKFAGQDEVTMGYNDSGSAARFFYSAKASKADRNGSRHPTVKPIDLIAYLQRMITPPGGTILEPFGGSGTGIAAAQRNGMRIIAIEQDPWYFLDMTERLK